MKIISECFTVTFLIAVLVGSSVVNAALISRLGGQAVYDTDLDITWLADANAGAGSAFDDGSLSTTDGRMSWANANAWAASLTVDGFTGWRLATTADPDASCTDDTAGTTPSADAIGYNCTGSEMGHLFYNELGATAGTSVLTTGNPTELAKFTNIQSHGYWSSTQFAANPGNAWVFGTSSGLQFSASQANNNQYYAWAVRNGDVAVVPVPAAIWLFGSGLIGLIGIAKRKKV